VPKRKYEKPLKLDMDFEQALERFARADPKEVQEVAVAEAGRLGMVPLVEDDSGHRFLVYATEKGIRTDLRYEGDTFWASQTQMAKMFGVDRRTVGEHLVNIYREGELSESATSRKFRRVQQEGNRRVERDIEHYDLIAVISVGYRVGSVQGTMFRIWATDKLFQILTKGFYIDKDRLKNRGEPDALDELREIAREIRTSIRNSYREVLRLCTFCSDYDGSKDEARDFFMDMENKLLWASANKTAPQLVLERCSAEKKDLGLTYYAGKRGPTQRDVIIGNNYLAGGEAERKNRATEMWLTYIEEQLDQGRLPTMEAVREKLVGFIRFNQWPLLSGKGKHSRKDADMHALEQLGVYRAQLPGSLE
jgi:hypothetical protein